VLCGYTAAEMIGEPIARLIPSDCAGELPVILERLRRGERIPPFETVRRRKDGWRLDVLVTISPVIDATGRILGAATIARDITAAKQLIAQLHALAYISEMLDHAHPDPDTVLESITNHVSQVLGDGAVLRLANGSVLELVAAHHRNAVARAVLLQSLQESVVEGRGLEGQVALSKLPLRISQLVSDESGPVATTPGVELQHYVDRVGLASLLVVPVRVADRSLGTLMVLRDRAGRPYTDADQTFLRMLAERLAVALENARLFASERQARAHAEHAVELLEQSVGLRDQVLLTVSHDMRNPLMVIMGHAQVLDLTAAQSGALADSPLRRGLERIMKAARAVNGDLDELVDASRLQLGEPLVLLRAPTDLVALAVQTIETWRVSTPGHRFEFAHREVALVGMWDRRRLARVLDNLLANAAKYSPAGSLISIRLCSAHSEAGQVAVLEVQDEGIGIDATDVPHIFKWFRRGRNVAHIGGTGIGLASAAGVIAQHGGSLRVESQPGRGSTFVLELPLLGRSVDPQRQPRRAMDGPETGQ
jgi:PAS domain S-box-containing protein